MGSAEALDRFERQTAWPMLVLALVSIPLFMIPTFLNLPDGPEAVIIGIDWFIWAAFALEYGIRLYLAPAKGEFVRRNLIDLAVVALPLLRPLRVARSARMLALLRATRSGIVLLRAAKAVQVVFTKHGLQWTLLIVSATTVGIGLAVAEIERGRPETNIESPSEGIWWAITTVTTVGYGDAFPVSAPAKALAAILMVIGIGVFGILAANLASFLIERRSSDEPTLRDVMVRLDRLEREIQAQGSKAAPDQSE